MTARIVGIDPGLSGAYAVLDLEGELIVVGDLPVAGAGTQRRIDPANLARQLAGHEIILAALEQVGARPGQGLGSTFRFGMATGCVAGVLGALAIRTEWIAASSWKRAMRLGADKEVARQRALERFPAASARFARKADHNRAEAALLAVYALQKRRQ